VKFFVQLLVMVKIPSCSICNSMKIFNPIYSTILAIPVIFMFMGLQEINGQDTFSIVAIDSVSGEIGSAGASCVGSSTTYPHGAQILSDVLPGIGAIHTQAAWNPVNQQNAHDWMVQGLSPLQIIDSLVAHDAQGNPTTRQYGIVDYNDGHPRSAGYTGINCTNYKNDTAHLNYSIQGNILIGQQILDSMQTRFMNTPGTLGDRLMAALQGAKVIGADTRCAVHNTSSQSAFLRVGRMTDPPDSLHLDLWMAYPSGQTGIFPVDPIDSLQTLYNLWKATINVKEIRTVSSALVSVYNDPGGITTFDFTRCHNYQGARLTVFDIYGRVIISEPVVSRIMKFNFSGRNSKGILIWILSGKDQEVLTKGKFMRF
jgi:uncharacterized Ntn-hydrolase superfamily protein